MIGESYALAIYVTGLSMKVSRLQSGLWMADIQGFIMNAQRLGQIFSRPVRSIKALRTRLLLIRGMIQSRQDVFIALAITVCFIIVVTALLSIGA